MNKKGAFGFSEYWELVIILILFVIVVLIALYVSGTAEINVDAKIDGMNAEFTCKNNLINFLLFPTKDGGSFDDLILRSYANEDYTQLGEEVSALFGLIYENNEWKLSIYEDKKFLYSVGDIYGSRVEDCDTYLPLPCNSATACTLTLKLEMVYE